MSNERVSNFESRDLPIVMQETLGYLEQVFGVQNLSIIEAVELRHIVQEVMAQMKKDAEDFGHRYVENVKNMTSEELSKWVKNQADHEIVSPGYEAAIRWVAQLLGAYSLAEITGGKSIANEKTREDIRRTRSEMHKPEL